MQCQCSFARVVSAQTTTVRMIYELSALEQFQSTKKTNPYIYYFLLISGFVLHLSSACPRVNRCTCDVGQVCFKRKEKNLISLGFKGKLIEWMFGGLLMLLPLRISVETFNKQRHRGTKTSKLKKKKKKNVIVTLCDSSASAEAFKKSVSVKPLQMLSAVFYCCYYWGWSLPLLQLRQWTNTGLAALKKTVHDTEQSCQKLIPVAGIFVLNPCHERKENKTLHFPADLLWLYYSSVH